MTRPALSVQVLTLFPELIETCLAHSILRRAQAAGHFQPRIVNIRDYTRDKHRTADDKPYGGGSGMVMKIEPIARALAAIGRRERGKVYLLSPTGRRLDQAFAGELAASRTFTLICGRYEGVDQRVADKLCDGEISIGDYVLSGGEPAAVVVLDAAVRLIPGVLGAEDSASRDSFSDGLLDYPHYTRPASYRRWQVPDRLLSGDHAGVAAWRREQQLRRTLQLRPDLVEQAHLSPTDLDILEQAKRQGHRRRRK